MERATRPFTKRSRASLACNACRQSKSKCDGNRPSCDRCANASTECVYSRNDRDKRLDKQQDRRENLVLRSRIKELEEKLATASLVTQKSSLNASAGDESYDPGDKSPSQVSHGGLSDVGSRVRKIAAESTPESSADAIATGLFDHPPILDIGYFGSSSNHAFFWSLSSSIENVSHRSSYRYQEPSHQGQQPEELPPTQILPAPVSSNQGQLDVVDDSFPGRRVAIEWTTRFFDTIGGALPYISEPDVLKEIDTIDFGGNGWSTATRSWQALLSIIFAYALCTLDSRTPFPFYRRALTLLDEQTLYIPTVDALQALLLLANFQQNTQRSMESWTPHYLAVRVAYQLGIHAPSSYDHHGVQDKEVRARLWFAIVNQDRLLTAGLARPALIPPQHVQAELVEFLDISRPPRPVNSSYSRESLLYFRHIISLHEIIGETVDSLHGSNINSTNKLEFGELVSKTIGLSWKLERWCEGAATPGILSPSVDLSTWSAASFDVERYKLLLTIFHYRAMMLIHASLLLKVLEQVTSEGDDSSMGVLHETALSILKNYCFSIKRWLKLIQAILKHKESFLACNAVWWVCNYMMLSTSIHVFAFWLLSSISSSSSDALQVRCDDMEEVLRSALETLRKVGGTSIMSRKAHRCLHRYLSFLKTIEKGLQNQRTLANAVTDVDWVRNDAAGQSHELRPDTITSCIDDMFAVIGQEDFMNTSFLGLGHQEIISDFDATGFI